MSREEFTKYIKSIGFNTKGYNFYHYKEFRIDLHYDYYHFSNGYELSVHYYTDLDPIYNNFKNELRSIKLKELLR